MLLLERKPGDSASSAIPCTARDESRLIQMWIKSNRFLELGRFLKVSSKVSNSETCDAMRQAAPIC